MKNLKKFLAVVLAVAIMATSMATAFAADAADPLAEKYPEAALMRDLGILQGSTGVTEAYLAQKPVRIQAAILTLRLMGKEADARAYAGLASFADKIADGYWAKSIMGYLKWQPAYGWRGDGQGKMNPEAPITKKEFAKVLVIALKYPEPLWDEVMGAYKAAGLTYLDGADDAINMNDIAIALDQALRTPVKGSSNTLAWTLSTANEDFKAKAIAKGLIQAVAIKSVANVNLGSVAEGTEIVPPATVVATMTDGSTKDVAVVWEKVDTSKAGDVTVKGTVEGFAAGATATVKVVAASITGVEAVEVTAYVGEDAVLPETVKATYSNGLVADVAVVWEDVDTSEVAELEVKGTIEGYEAGVVAKVSVVDLVIDEVAVEDITVNEGEDVVLPDTVVATLSNGETADVAVEWEDVDFAAAGTYEVKGTVEGYEGDVVVKVEVKAVALDFTVAADNLTEVIVTFNKAVASDKLVKGNFQVNGVDAANATVVDGKTVRLLGGAIAQQGKFEVTVKKAVGVAADTKKSTSAVIDAVVPTVVNVEAVGNSSIKVTFSEPVVSGFDTLSNYKLNNSYFGANVPTVDASARVLTIVPTTRLASGVNKLSISNVKDAANYVIAPVEKEFVVATDSTAPSFVSVESATQTKVVLVMSEEIVTPADADVVATVNETGRSVDGNKLTLTYGVGAAAVPVNGMTVTLKNITDVYGNKIAADITVNIPAPTLDLVKPAFVSAVAEGNSNASMKIVVTFDKEVQVGGTFTLKDADGEAVAVNAVQQYKDADNKAVLTKLYVDGNIADGTYKLSVSGVKDNSGLQNEMLPVVDVVVTVADKTAPTVANWYKVGQKLYVSFDTVVNEATAKNKANYTYIDTPEAGVPVVKALNDDTTVTLLADNQSVMITFDAATDMATVDVLQVAGVADVNGNVMATTSKATAGLGAPTAVTATAEVTGKNTIVVTVNRALVPSTISLNDFAVTAGAGLRVYNAVYADKKITLSIVEDIGNNAKVGGNAVAVSIAAGVTAADAFGTKITAGPIATTDGIVPTIAVKSAIGAAGATVVKLQASEALVNTNGNTDKQFVVVVEGALKAYTTTWNAADNTLDINIAEDLSGKVVSVKYFKPAASKITDGTKELAEFDLKTAAVE